MSLPLQADPDIVDLDGPAGSFCPIRTKLSPKVPGSNTHRLISSELILATDTNPAIHPLCGLGDVTQSSKYGSHRAERLYTKNMVQRGLVCSSVVEHFPGEGTP